MALTESYWPADESHPVLDLTVGELLRQAAGETPDTTALVCGVPGESDRRWTYAELLDESERVARSLLERFDPGERVAVWAPNLPEWVLLEFGAALAGVVLVTVNPAYRTGELEYVLRQSRAVGVFLSREHRGNAMLESLESVGPVLAELRERVVFDDWQTFVDSGSEGTALPEVAPTSPAQIQYTSGTTGFPKGALLHHRGITNNARFIVERFEVRAGDVWVNPMPMFHTAGCVIAALGAAVARATHIPVLQFEPTYVLELLEQERGTHIGAVPTMLVAMMEEPSFTSRDLSSLRSVVSGGSSVPAELVRRVEDALGIQFAIVYGQTESSPVITQTRLDDTPLDKSETVGQPLAQTEVKIIDPATGEVVPIGASGEVCTRGYLVMDGYFEMPEATAEAIDGDGWLHTGDLGSMDERGYCKIVGRLKDMIIRGGENIYPREIEEQLFAHPAVGDVAVVGLPDERWGEIVAAFIRLAPDGPPAVGDELRAFVRERLAAFKTPERWFLVDQFPLTPSGKIQKFVLREMADRGEFEPLDTLRPATPSGGGT